MKKVFISILSVFLALYFFNVNAADNGLMQGPPPQQQYQDANSPAPETHKPAEQPANANSPANATSGDQAEKPASTANQNPAVSNSGIAVFQATIDQMNQNVVLFQQETTRRLTALEQKNTELEQKIEDQTEALIMLNQEVAKLRFANSQDSMNSNKGFWSNLKSKIKTKWVNNPLLFWIIIGAVILILMIVAALIASSRSRKNSRADTKIQATENENFEDEYDYLGSAEGVAAKLDLARAYRAMEDFPAARKVLEEVMAQGNEEQKQEARKLLLEVSNYSK